MKPIWLWRSQAHSIYENNSYAVVPIFRAVGLHWHGARHSGGWLWQFPLGVEVEERASGTRTHLPIPDPTRTVLWFLISLALVMLLVTSLVRRQRVQQAKRAKATRKS